MQSLRGLAVLLLVAGHVYGLSANTGMRVSGDTVGRYLTDSFEFLRMPLFTVISGYVYALRPVRASSALPRLVRGKARRLLLPLLPLTALVGGLQIVAARGQGDLSVTDVALGYVYGYSHLWFLQAIFVVFLVVGVLDAFGRLSTLRGWAVAVVVGLLLYVGVHLPDALDVFSLNGAIQLFPFFLLGYGLKRFEQLRRPRVLWATAAAFCIALVVDQVVVLTDPELPAHLRRAALAAAGATGVTVLFHLRRALCWRPLAWIGSYAFTIYLLHTIANSGAKIALGMVGLTYPVLVFGVGLVAAILAPIVFHVTVGRIALVRTFLLGEKPVEPVAPTPERSTVGIGDAAAPEGAAPVNRGGPTTRAGDPG